MLKEQEDNEIYIVVDTENNRLTLRQGDKVLLTAVVAPAAGSSSRRRPEGTGISRVLWDL